MSANLTHIDCWIFDLDNTLYPASCNLFALIDVRMGAFIQEMFGCDPARAREIQKTYYHSHGTTLSGLMVEHGLKPEAFLDYVHDIDLSSIAPDGSLRESIARLPGRKLVFTNGSRGHAERVTEKLGIHDLFDDLHDIVATDYTPKPHADAYHSLLQRSAISPDSAVMFEDIARNLLVPHALGMTTVLVSGAKDWETDFPVPEPETNDHIHHICDDLAAFLSTAKVAASNTDQTA